MNCKNHPDVAAVDRCAGCAELFCSNCLVDMQGQKYCGSCKVMALEDGAQPALPDEGTEPCKEANEALTYAIIGIFCCGIILEPIALVKASEAKKKIGMNPRLAGSSKATAAQIIAVIALILWVIGMFARFSQMGNVN